MPPAHKQLHTTQRNVRLPYLPALDGLRAIAVIAVLCYHAGLGMSGGFLGVETFFVLSGFLVTALLFAEWEQHGSVDFAAFWLRRARRLLPALGLVLAAVIAVTALVFPLELADLGPDLLASLGYIMNWHLIWSQQSYFDPMLRPPLLQHLWSLAIEEQFYLIWPVLFLIGMRLLGRRGLVLALLTLAGASIAAMYLMYEPGVDPSRLYYGTDTRASGLLIGAALAMLWQPGKLPVFTQRWAGRSLDLLGIAALIVLGVAYFEFFSAHPLLYQGGIFGVALATALLIAASTHPQARLLPTALGWAPLRWIGVRSYGIYLWHWPIFELFHPMMGIPIDGIPLLVLQIGLTLLLSGLSYRFIETPIRSGAGFRPVWDALRRTSHAFTHMLVALATPVPASNRQLIPVIHAMPQTAGASNYTPAQPRVQQPRRTAPANRFASIALSITLLISVATCAAPAAGPSAAPSPIRPPDTATAPLVPTATNAPSPAPTATSEPSPSPAPTATSEPSPSPAPTATSEPALAAFSPELAAALQRVLDRIVADGAIPGAVAAVYIPGTEPWSGASGFANRGTQLAMTPETRVRIASISKIFTAVVVLQLVEEGQISLDDPLATWFPELVPAAARITIRDLLQHTTGLYDYLEDRNYVSRAYQTPDRNWTPDELVGYAAGFPPTFAPGAEGRWDYSSTNYVILGMVVEAVTGKTLAQEMRTRIFTPLKLESTFFAPDEPVGGTQANGYARSVDQTRVAMSMVFATANIVSTVDDLRKFADGLFGGKLLKPETLEFMQQTVNGKGQYNMPALEYGLGLMKNRLPVGPGPDGQPRPAEVVTVFGHIGGFGGFRSALWYAPESGIIVAIGVNQASTDPNILATRIFDTALTGTGR